MSPSRRAFIVVLSILTTISVVGLLVTPASAGVGPNPPGTTDPSIQPGIPGRWQPTGPIHWTLSDAEVLEGDSTNPGVLEFQLSVSHAPSENLMFYATTQGAFAKAGEDFVPLEDMPVFFPAGATSITIEVQVIGDVWIENDEVMILNVWRPLEGGGYFHRMAFGTILNDDDLWYGLPPIEIPKAGPRWF